jgi:hypothetical protein
MIRVSTWMKYAMKNDSSEILRTVSPARPGPCLVSLGAVLRTSPRWWNDARMPARLLCKLNHAK